MATKSEERSGSAAVTDGITFTVLPATRRASAAERERIMANPGFGKVFTEHLASISWDREQG
jgi:branched-chain amino acid aminotransferase